MKSKYYVLVMLLISFSGQANEYTSISKSMSVNKYAFDFSADPSKVSCFKVTLKLSKKFISCEQNLHFSADSPVPSKYSCKGTRGKEYLIFNTLKQCVSAKSTMENNAP